jgi:hypothetical protein
MGRCHAAAPARLRKDPIQPWKIWAIDQSLQEREELNQVAGGGALLVNLVCEQDLENPEPAEYAYVSSTFEICAGTDNVQLVPHTEDKEPKLRHLCHVGITER